MVERVAELTRKLSAEEEDALALKRALDPEIAEALMAAQGGSIEQTKNNEDREKLRVPILNMHMRHQAIVRLRAQGMHPTRIARAIGVTRTTVDNVVKKWYEKHAEDLKHENIDQFVLMLADGYLEDIDKLTEVIEKTRMAPALVGAIKARQEARQKYVDILAEFGFLNRKPLEVNVTHEGQGDTYNQMIFLNPADLKRASMEFLNMKHRLNGDSGYDAEEDERLSGLLVASDSPENPGEE